MQFKTLIIGSGIAGLNFALHAAEYGPVLILTKKRTVESSTNRAQGGIAAVLDQADRFEQHVKDTMEAGSHHNVREAVEFMVKNGPAAIRRLIEMGVPFATDVEGELLLTREGGHGSRRIAFVGDYTGEAIERVLVQKVEEHPNITVWEHAFAMDLLVSDGCCFGVQVLRENEGGGNEVLNVFGDHVILATGGLGQIYRYTTNPSISTGDGIAMGIRAGLECRDLEFVQFHPTAFKLGGRTKFLLSEALRGEGAHLLDSKGERFMVGEHPLAELAPRDVVARVVYREDLEGGAFLAFCRGLRRPLHSPLISGLVEPPPLASKSEAISASEIILRFPTIYQTLKKYGLDLTRDRVPIAPAAHYSCGGVVTDLHGATAIQNLYAFGEVAWTGVHGANRLASNSLLEALVFSNQILEQTRARHSKRKKPSFKIPMFFPLTRELKRRLQLIQRNLRKVMWEKVGIVRTQENLKEAVHDIQKLQTELPQLKGATNVLLKETENMILVGLAVAEAAQKRKESLGAHFLD